jgi:hypothetical protein
METLQNIEYYASQKAFTYGVEMLKANYEESLLIALVANHMNRRTILSQKIIRGCKSRFIKDQLIEAIKYLTLTIDTLITEVERMKEFKKGEKDGKTSN